MGTNPLADRNEQAPVVDGERRVLRTQGRNVEVRLIGSTDSSLATTFRVDTVSLRTDG